VGSAVDFLCSQYKEPSPFGRGKTTNLQQQTPQTTCGPDMGVARQQRARRPDTLRRSDRHSGHRTTTNQDDLVTRFDFAFVRRPPEVAGWRLRKRLLARQPVADRCGKSEVPLQAGPPRKVPCQEALKHAADLRLGRGVPRAGPTVRVRLIFFPKRKPAQHRKRHSRNENCGGRKQPSVRSRSP